MSSGCHYKCHSHGSYANPLSFKISRDSCKQPWLIRTDKTARQMTGRQTRQISRSKIETAIRSGSCYCIPSSTNNLLAIGKIYVDSNIVIQTNQRMVLSISLSDGNALKFLPAPDQSFPASNMVSEFKTIAPLSQMISQTDPSYFPAMTSPIRSRGRALTNQLAIPQKQEGREGNRWESGTMASEGHNADFSPPPPLGRWCPARSLRPAVRPEKAEAHNQPDNTVYKWR